MQTTTYYLNVPGQQAVAISLDEMRRQRTAGQLHGTELVWTHGMPQWLPVDLVLQAPPTTGGPWTQPPPLTRPSTQRNAVVIALVVFGVLAALAIMLFAVNRAIQRFRAIRAQVQRQTLPQAGVRGAGGEDVKIAGKAVTWTTNTITWREVRQRGRSFRTRQWLDGYKERGARGGACDAASINLLQTWIEENYGVAHANAVSVAELSDQIAANPACTDPLVLTIAGVEGIEVFENRRRLERALAAFPQSRHRAYPKLYATLILARDLSGDAGRVAALHSSAVSLLKEAFADRSIQPEDQAEIADIFVNTWGRNFFSVHGRDICQIVRAQGKPFEWLALMLDGERNINEAWQARGSGYADSVSEKGWQGFSTHLASAHASLTAAWKLRPDLPLAASRMIPVVMGETGLEDMRLWFDRAVAAQIDVPQAWDNMRWGLRPRWDGSLESMLVFGIQAVNTRRFDTDVPRKFFDVVTDLESELQTRLGEHIYGRSDIWPHFQTLYEGYIAEPSQSEWRNGWRSTYCIVAYFARHYDVARKQLEALNWKLLPEQGRRWGRDLSLLPLEVAARTGPANVSVASAEMAYTRHDLPGALKAFQALQDHADERTAAFARTRVAALTAEQQLANGEWVNLLPQKEDDANWVIAFGKLKCLPDGAVEIESAARGHMMFSRTRMPSDFEVQGEFDVVASSNGSFQAGLVMGEPDFDDSTWYSFRMKRNQEEKEIVSFANGWSANQVYEPVKLDDKHNSFILQFQHGTATASVNGRELLHGAAPRSRPYIPNDQFFLGVGAYIDSNKTVIRYRNVKVRRLQTQNSR